MLEINLIFLTISMLIYALYARFYFVRNRNKFRVHFLLATLISSVLSILFWNVYEIWSVEFSELLSGAQMKARRKMQEEWEGKNNGFPSTQYQAVSLFSYFSLLH